MQVKTQRRARPERSHMSAENAAAEPSRDVRPTPHSLGRSRQDPLWVRVTLITAAFAVVGLLIVVPVVHVFYQALKPGVATYFHNLWGDADTRHAVLLTLIVAPISVAANVI